jgi:hypothetical protein
MAREAQSTDNSRVIAISKQEAVDLISRLAAQLGDRPVSDAAHAGACPSLRVFDWECSQTLYHLELVIDQDR